MIILVIFVERGLYSLGNSRGKLGARFNQQGTRLLCRELGCQILPVVYEIPSKKRPQRLCRRNEVVGKGLRTSIHDGIFDSSCCFASDNGEFEDKVVAYALRKTWISTSGDSGHPLMMRCRHAQLSVYRPVIQIVRPHKGKMTWLHYNSRTFTLASYFEFVIVIKLWSVV